MTERTPESIITELRADPNQTFETRDDVEFVLDHTGAPGDHRDLKDEVVRQLFTKRSPQGYRTVDDLTSYANY